MRAFSTAIITSLLFASTQSASAVLVAYQGFNGLSDSGGPSFDSVADGGSLTNTNSFNSGGTGLDFGSTWNLTGNSGSSTVGPVTATSDTSDFIGVNSFGGSDSPDVSAFGVPVASGREHNFQFNDTDGRLDLTFESVDTTGFFGRTFSMKYWINDTGFESADSFVVTVNDGSTDTQLLSLVNTDLEVGPGDDGNASEWFTLTADLDALGVGDVLTLTISADTNSGAESIFVDNIRFEAIPEPSAFLFGGLVCSVFGVNYTRKQRQSRD